MINKKLASIFYEIADILEMKNIAFKPQAYRKAARAIERFGFDIRGVYRQGGLKALDEIPGVGKNIALKIEEFIKTGRIKHYEKLRKSLPDHMIELLDIPHMGPKKVKKLYEELGITSVDKLKKAARAEKIRNISGFGEKSEAEILESLGMVKKRKRRVLLAKVLPIIQRVEKNLKNSGYAIKVVSAGSVRRREKTIGDLDILATSKSPNKLIDFFTSMSEVKKVVARGKTKASIILKNSLPSDLRVVKDGEYGSALQYFTGNKDHNIKLRNIAISKGFKLSEYGLFNRKTGKKVAGKTEEEIYKKLGMRCMPPTERKNRGEIEKAINAFKKRL